MATASNSFLIVISAADKATATIRKINDSVSKLTRPFDEVGKSFKSLGREIGIDKIGKNLSKIGSTARNAARGVGEIVAPLAGITGMATIAGIIGLADSWAKLGRSITYSAQNIGINATQLQEFQAAARLAGLSSDAMTQSLNSLGNTMEDALYGRNQQALMLFNRLTGGIKRTKDGAMDATGEFRALAAAIYKMKTPQQQNLAANQFGISALLPLIRQGPQAFDRLIAKARQLGIVMTPGQIASANAFAASLAEMDTSVTALKQSVGNALIPALEPLLQQLTSWVSQNRELISTKITEWAKELGHWLQNIDWKGIGNDIAGFIKDIQSVVNFLGGWKNAAIAAVVVMNGSLIASVLNLTLGLGKLGIGLGANILQLGKWTAAATRAGGAAGLLGKAGGVAAAGAAGWAVGSFISKHFVEGTKFGDALGSGEAHIMAFLGSSAAREAIAQSQAKSDNVHNAAWYRARQQGVNKNRVRDQNAAMTYFMSQGWSKAQAAGIVANIDRESNMRVGVYGDYGKAYGLGQWHKDRQEQFAKLYGHSIIGSSMQEQLEFYNWELHHTQKHAGDLLAQATNPFAAGGIVSAFDERPRDTQSEIMARGGQANQLFADYKPVPGPYTAGGAKDSEHKVEVAVNVSGLPQGTTAKVNTTGATTGTARVAHTTVGATS